MPIASLLLPKFLADALNALFEHIGVTVVVAVVILVIGFFRERLVDFTSWFVAVRVHGVWDTTIEPDHHKTGNSGENHKHETKEESHETDKVHDLIGLLRNQLSDLWGWLVGTGLHGNLKQKPGEGTKEEPHETARLHQFFNKVWGETECKENPEKTFRVRGQIVGEKLSLVYRATEGFYCGAILLQITNTKLMRGFEIGRDRETGDIYTKSYTWHRRSGRLN